MSLDMSKYSDAELEAIAGSGVDPKTGTPVLDVTPGDGMSVAEKMNNPYFEIDTPEKLKAEVAKETAVPDWGREHPNLYGLYGAAKGVGAATVEGGAMAAGTALGAASPVPGGAIMGGGAGYAAGKRLASKVGLSDEPIDNSALGITKDLAIGSAFGAVPGLARFAGKGVRALPGGNTLANFVSEVPIGAGMIDKARSLGPRVATSDLAGFAKDMDVSFAKAVRPGVAGNRTAAQATDYADSARAAAKEIVLNKESLNLTDEFGEAVDHLPKTLPQFRDALDATKISIWRRVEAINEAAGDAGAKVTLQPAVKELQSLMAKPAYRTMSPETVDYAGLRMKDLSRQGAFTVADAQEALTLANQSAKHYYANPTADNASRAAVDALVANNIRGSLDAALEAATGSPAAAPLRKAYGALKTIEKDVNQRAVVDARKNMKGLIDFADIYTAGELVSAIATMNPAGIAKVGGMAALKARIKWWNNPNTHVERLFKTADKLVSPRDFPMPKGEPRPPAPPVVMDMKTNTLGLKQPGPNIPKMDMRTNTGNLSAPSRAVPLDMSTNTGNLAPPSRAVNLDMKTNTGGIVQPGPNVPVMDMRTNTGGLSAPSQSVPLDMKTNTGGIVQPVPPKPPMGQVMPSAKADPAWKQVISPNLLGNDPLGIR